MDRTKQNAKRQNRKKYKDPVFLSSTLIVMIRDQLNLALNI